ncbi:hypothetical protein D7V94_10195 [Parablautia intestinalis]|jgi:hypothetical protein|uniref:Uncharacterized protein n=1 Tax=Parablautia intestinalis TaxID=2320100 RepID=A0A3A9AY30_9FIRM|nr:hypothetical protein [Parablautia intestinalis]MCI8614352.1 hypothetical protein [Lachnospiraceae bacterium]MDE7048728.1 hypothetical protein [Lachnospiraceae bacterium]RKI91275.1 hypothetical protein D7V94_10195 [Parablautia intestinalis]
MGDWNIQLKAADLNGWIISVEESLTKVRDFLAVLEQEERGLKNVFDSGARLQWERGFQDELVQIREKIAEMEEITLWVEELARDLTRLEKSLIAEAEGLHFWG